MADKPKEIENCAEKLSDITSQCKFDFISVSKPNKSFLFPIKAGLNAYAADLAIGCSIASIYTDESVAKERTSYTGDPMNNFKTAFSFSVNGYSKQSVCFDGGDAS